MVMLHILDIIVGWVERSETQHFFPVDIQRNDSDSIGRNIGLISVWASDDSLFEFLWSFYVGFRSSTQPTWLNK
jgi:hypothetical protein